MNKTIVAKKLEKLNYYEKFLLLRRHPMFQGIPRFSPIVLGSIGGKADKHGPDNVFLGTSDETAKKLHVSKNGIVATRNALVKAGVLVLEIPSKGRTSPVYSVNDEVLDAIVTDVLLNRKSKQWTITVNRPAETTEVPTPAPSPVHVPVPVPVPAPVEQPVVVVPKPSTDEQPVAAAPEPSTVEPPVSGETKPAPAPPRFNIPAGTHWTMVIKILTDAVKIANPQMVKHVHKQAKLEGYERKLKLEIPALAYELFVEDIDKELERKLKQLKAHPAPDPLNTTPKSGLKA